MKNEGKGKWHSRCTLQQQQETGTSLCTPIITCPIPLPHLLIERPADIPHDAHSDSAHLVLLKVLQPHLEILEELGHVLGERRAWQAEGERVGVRARMTLEQCS